MKAVTMKSVSCGIVMAAAAPLIALSGCGGNGSAAVTKSPPLPVVCSNTSNGARFQVLDFGVAFSPYAANASGTVVGYKLVSGKTHTVVMSPAGVATDIGLDDSLPVAVNDAGQVAGNTLNGFVWQNGQTAMLKNLPGGTRNYLADMNNNGEIVGSANTGQKTSSGSDVFHAVYWANAQAVPQDLGVLNSADEASGATSISDLGAIVGYSGAVLGKANYVYLASHTAQMKDLGLLAGDSSSGGFSQLNTVYITKSGLIVGMTFFNGAVDTQVFLMKYGSAPTYDSTLNFPSKPNSSDQFVVTTKAGGYSLYEPGKGAQDLIAQLPTGCSVKLTRPVAIADGGHIIANGTVSGVNHGFLITP